MTLSISVQGPYLFSIDAAHYLDGSVRLGFLDALPLPVFDEPSLHEPDTPLSTDDMAQIIEVAPETFHERLRVSVTANALQ